MNKVMKRMKKTPKLHLTKHHCHHQKLPLSLRHNHQKTPMSHHRTTYLETLNYRFNRIFPIRLMSHLILGKLVT